MNQILTKKVSLASLKANVPDIRAGHTVRVHQKISEGGKDRVQVFEGLVIKVSSGHGISKTFTVRRIVSGVGVEKIFPLHCGNIEKIELVKKAKVRRAKLFHMRDLTGKSARLREKYYTDADAVVMDPTAAAAAEVEREAEVLTVDPLAEQEKKDEAEVGETGNEETVKEEVAEVETKDEPNTGEKVEESSEVDDKTEDAEDSSEKVSAEEK